MERKLAKESNRRWHHRRGSAFDARVVTGELSSAIPCLVQNISANGAQIVLPNAVELPPQFTLDVPSLGLKVEVRVAWSRAQHHGVSFVWPQHSKRGRAGARLDPPLSKP